MIFRTRTRVAYSHYQLERVYIHVSEGVSCMGSLPGSGGLTVHDFMSTLGTRRPGKSRGGSADKSRGWKSRAELAGNQAETSPVHGVPPSPLCTSFSILC